MRLICLILLPALLWPLTLPAQQCGSPGAGSPVSDTSEAGSFDEALDMFTLCQLAPRAERDKAEADILDLRSDNMLAAPEAEFSRVWGTAGMGNKWTLSVTQSFDWPGLYRARARAIEKSADAVKYLQAASVAEVRMRGRLLLLDVIYARRREAEVGRLHQRISDLEETLARALSDQQATILDHNKIVIEHIRLDRMMSQAHTALVVAEDQVMALCGAETGRQVLSRLGSEYPDSILPPAMTEQELAQVDPGIAAARASMSAATETARADRLARLPGFSVGYVHEKELGGSFNGFSVGVSLPWLANKHRRQATELRLEASRTELALQTARRMGEFRQARAKAEATQMILERYRTALDADRSYGALQKALEQRQITMLDYITEIEFILQARQDYQEELYNYHLALAQLRRFR